MKTHWKQAFDSPYLGSWDLPDYKDLTLTIDKVVNENSQGLKENSKFNIAYFKEKGFKPMLLNATNSKSVKHLARSPYIEDWAGTRITLYVESVRAFGENHDALRIRKVTAQKVKPTLDENHPKWDEIKEKVKAGLTIEQIKKHYNIKQEVFNKLSE